MTSNPLPAPKLDISTRVRQGVISGRVLTVLVVSFGKRQPNAALR